MTSTSEALTHGIRVSVECRYSREHSQPQRNQWFFLYTIRISNEGDEGAQLLSRHWYIGDATGRVEEVQGSGVVGENPLLEPGDNFEYTSGCPLGTPFGWMEGSYEMVRRGGQRFEAKIARFALREPGAIH